MRQLVYTIFITNNHASFHLWWKENLLKYQKVSKYYVHNCSSHIIESDDEDIIQHLEEEASNAVLTNIFGEESSDSDSEDDI